MAINEESQLMVTRAQGLRALETFKHGPGSAKLFAQPVVLTLRVLVRLGSHRAPDTEDLAVFSDSCPFFSAEPGPDSESFYLTALSRDDSSVVTESDRTVRLMGSVFRYLSGLSIMSESLATWRSVSLQPHDLELRRGDGTLVGITFDKTPVNYTNARRLHTGDLWGALDSLVKTGGWPSRFFEIYQRGCELMAMPVVAMGSFLEESYLCFFRCLEHVVMAEILDKSGQFNGHCFQEACKRLGASPNDPNGPKKHAGRLIAERGHAVAHLLKKQADAKIDPQKLGDLKSTLDLICRVLLRQHSHASKCIMTPI